MAHDGEKIPQAPIPAYTYIIAEGDEPIIGRTLPRPDGVVPAHSLIQDAHASVPVGLTSHKAVIEGLDAAIHRAGGQVTPQNAGQILVDAAAIGGVELPDPDQGRAYGPEPAPSNTDPH